MRGQVTRDAEAPAVGRNYHRVGVRLRDGTPLTLLLNDEERLVAAARPDDAALPQDFTDLPHGEVFAAAGFRVATAAELEQPLTGAHVRTLTKAERRDVAYHRPERLGDLLFTWFD